MIHFEVVVKLKQKFYIIKKNNEKVVIEGEEDRTLMAAVTIWAGVL